MQKYIPSIITLLNLMSGFLAILLCDTFYSPLLIGLGALFDVFDGLTARLLNAKSEIGKQLDSFADLVSFGVAPAYLMYQTVLDKESLLSFSVLLIPAFSAIRLAIFNLDSTQTTSFKGLPTPANGLFFASIPFIYANNASFLPYINQYIAFLPIIFSILLVAPLRMFSIKGINKGLKHNIFPLLFLLSCLVLIPITGLQIFPISIVLYVLFSIPYHIFSHKKIKR